MKKAILAVIIPSILFTSSAFAGIYLVKNDDVSVNFNGDIDLKLLYKENNDVNTSSIDANFDDFDFTFKYFVSDGLTLIAETDWTSESDKKSGVVNAGVWAGFKTDYGLLRFGYQANSFDPFGIDSSELTSAGMASGDLDGDGTDHPESIVYEHKINNVWFSGTYGYEGADKDQSRQLQLAVRYIVKDLNFGAGIGNTKAFEDDDSSATYGDVIADGTYAQAEVDYTWGKLRTAALVSYLKNDTNDRELNGYEIDVSYMITSKLRLAAGWDRIDQDMGALEDDNSIDNVYLALKYKWNKYASIHAELGQRDGDFAKFNGSDKAYDEKLAGILLDLDF
ncbi:hypothetical protein GCM10007916_26270 [Psychromonas marina]|uniref:Porin domain-containing protein n=1 Tax=Psychromonas marina TaxID=88364 RepID=A0ABQ6E2Z3_9GAMM|nr:porin [Psychromonas marina]GLS91558.1 hypothetical protein GCM10007916_26270 [Psychromonas marina]